MVEDGTGLEEKMTIYLHSGAGDHFGADTLADTVLFRRASPMIRAAKQQAGRVLPVSETVNMLLSPFFNILQYYNCLATGLALRMAFFCGYTFNSATSGRQTSQKKSSYQNGA